MAVDGIVAALLGVGGPQLYRRNAFRVTGLPTDADRKTVRHRQRRVLAALEAGADVDLGHDLPVGTETVRAAFDEILENPHRRLVDELFWLWGNGSACKCTGTVHADHDAAVRAHSVALDLETRNGRLTGKDLARADHAWHKAARLWGTVLRRNGFWNHIRARVANLDERQLDESVVTVLREQVPLILLQPLIDLATENSGRRDWLVERIRSWPGVPDGTADHLLEEAATTYYDGADTALKQATEELGAGNVNRAVTVVDEQVVPCLDQLEALVPHRKHRRTARVRDRAALVLNNCATVLIERDGPGAEADAGRWLRRAHDLATDPMSHRTIKANQDTLAEMVTTFAIVEERVDELLAAGRPDLARTMLRGIRRQLGGTAGTAEVDRLLAKTDRSRVRRPSAARYNPRPAGYGSYRPRPRRGEESAAKLVLVVILIAVALAVFLLSRSRDTDSFFVPEVSDNEVLSCPALGEVLSPNPGQDQIAAEQSIHALCLARVPDTQ